VASIPGPSPADVMAAIAGLEVDGVTPAAAAEPVTMAVAAGAATSRWTAVSVALAPEEAAISLEQEMQKAYAAFAAAETGHSTVITAPQATQSVQAEPAVAPVEPAPVASAQAGPAAEQSVAVPATPAPEAAQGLGALAHAATDAITAAVKELEAVAASYLEHKSTAPAAFEPAPVEKVEAPRQIPEASQKFEPAVENASEPAKSEASGEAAKAEKPQTWREEQKEEQKVEALKHEAAEIAESKSDVAPPVAATAAPASDEVSKTAESAPEPAFVDAVSAEPTSASPASSEASVVSSGEPANKESEIAANTAAAWASWRRIRESAVPEGQPAQSSAKEKEPEEIASGPQDSAAMAVAAGAENSPEEASTPSDAASAGDQEGIASLVDSVLAEMRPKIYEEISRKMKKK